MSDPLPSNINYGGTMIVRAPDLSAHQGGTFATPADPMLKPSKQVQDDGVPYGSPTLPAVAEKEAKAASPVAASETTEESPKAVKGKGGKFTKAK